MMSPSLVCRKFNAMLGVATMAMAVNFLVTLTGSLIVGNLVGATGLAGLNVCVPVFAVVGFFASLLSVGAGLVFSQAMGAFDAHKASGVWSQTSCLSIGLGALVGLVMLAGGNYYMEFNGVTGEILHQARSYWRWQTLQMALTPLVLLTMAMIYADGDSLVAMLAGIAYVVGTIVFSSLFTVLLGDTGGVSFGTSMAMIVVLGVCSMHFLRKHNHLKFIRYFSWKDLGDTIANSAPDATIYLCWGLLILVVNRFTVAVLGRQEMLAVVALGASIVQFSIVFDGVGEAIIPLGGMYAGEDNWPAMRKLANYSSLMATAEGIIIGIIAFAFAWQICPFYGFRGANDAMLPDAVATMRALAFAMPFMGFLMMANTHFLVVKHPFFAVSVTVMKDFIFPCLMMFPCACVWGFNGVWIGFALGYMIAAAYPFVFVLIRYGRDQFPWLIPNDGGKIIDFSVRLTDAGVAAARERIERFLSENGIADVITRSVLFVIEETGIASIRANREKARRLATVAIAEYSVFLNRPGFVRLVTRDTGKSFDVNKMINNLARIAECRYLNTLSCNRSEYVFKRVL